MAWPIGSPSRLSVTIVMTVRKNGLAKFMSCSSFVRSSQARAERGGLGCVRSLAAKQLRQDPDIAHDDGYGKYDVDRIEPVDPDLEIGGALDLHELDVVDGCRKRARIEDQDR